MTGKLKKRLVCIIAFLAYTAGLLLTPIMADTSSANGFDALLEQRETSTAGIAKQESEKTIIENFTDIKQNDWFYPYLDYLVKESLIKGVTDTEFRPSGNFSYAECSTVITRYLGLEKEAAQYKKYLEKEYGIKNTIWYSGYFQVMKKLGIFEGYGLFETDGEWICSIDSEKANSPISRYNFAESISKSFELDSSLKAKNVYSETGGSGREFILGGGYKQSVLLQYEEYISDFEEIPEESREYILKAYYNGIFMGDKDRLFHPLDNLTRAEMAKVLATICDSTMRYRLIDDGYAETISESHLFYDRDGTFYLTRNKAEEILKRETEALSVSKDGVLYKQSCESPMGYAIDTYLYRKEAENKYSLLSESSLRSFSNGEIASDITDGRVLMVLRNTNEYNRPEGVLSITFSDGSISEISTMTREM